MEAYNTWLIIAEKYMISKFTVFCSERPTFKETTKKNRRDNPPYLCRPDFHGMNYSSYWIFYGNSSIFYIIAVKNIFIYAIIIMNVVVKWYFVILEIGIPHLNFLGAECEMWFGTAKTENSPRLSPRHLTRCWSNNGFFCLPPLIDSSLSSFNASQTIKTNILENKYWLAYGKKMTSKVANILGFKYAFKYAWWMPRVSCVCALVVHASTRCNTHMNGRGSVGPVRENVSRHVKKWPNVLRTSCVIMSAITQIYMMCHCRGTYDKYARQNSCREISTILEVNMETCKSK